MKCKVCETRKPRRSCPGVQGDICSICCGNEREVTIACPSDCPYLREAREHEKLNKPDPGKIPNSDIEIPDAFVRSQEALLAITALSLYRGFKAAGPQTVDSDVREALAALTQTYRTLNSGLIYNTRPTNPYAARICTVVEEELRRFRDMARAKLVTVRDSEILKALVFFQLMAYTRDNGRPKCRRFVEFLETFESNLQEEPQRLIEL